jgi:DNA-binding transcriptional LysR family regulator
LRPGRRGLKRENSVWCDKQIIIFFDMAISKSQSGHQMQLSDRIGRRLKLHDLHVLMAVAQAGSMRKAAALLNTTQPAISRSIAELEDAFGVRLLERSPQGIEPTQYGRALLRRSVAVFDELKQSGEDIEFLSSPDAGELRIGSGAALAEAIVLAVIDRLWRQYPRVAYDVAAGTLPSLNDELRERRIELALSAAPSITSEQDIDAEVLFEEPLVVVAAKDNPWVRRRKIELADLANEPWTWNAPRGGIYSLIVEAFRASGVEPPRATVYTDAINVRIRLAVDRGFLTFVPASVLKYPTKHPTIRKLAVDLPAAHRQVGIYTLKNRTLSPLAQLSLSKTLASSLAHSQRTSDRLGPPSIDTRRLCQKRPVACPRLPTCALQQGGSYLGYKGLPS